MAGSADYLRADQMKQIFLNTINEDLSSEVSKITQPSLLIWGKNDTETPLADANLMLSKLKNGTFKGTFELGKDATYEFKYVVDGVYVNEPEADSFKWNDFAGAENSVLVV